MDRRNEKWCNVLVKSPEKKAVPRNMQRLNRECPHLPARE